MQIDVERRGKASDTANSELCSRGRVPGDEAPVLHGRVVRGYVGRGVWRRVLWCVRGPGVEEDIAALPTDHAECE